MTEGKTVEAFASQTTDKVEVSKNVEISLKISRESFSILQVFEEAVSL